MIVFKNDIPTTFKVAYKSSFLALENINDVSLVFTRINADDTSYVFPAEIVSVDCFNRIIEITSTVSLETGEYKVVLNTIGAYSLDYSEDYERIDDQLLTIANDNANIKRENERVEDSSGVVYVE